ncbi:hypothetical protein NDU88_001584 [Pleurodeles waltl]|uniref:Uncharacterized protein n=1 Tax=Pleurodeles waltl TaxID=8319 RepID=A0AAV7RDA0_PLEWA|nr:hypothetical protein NDU88_001584 [Pleurodeles waltl]
MKESVIVHEPGGVEPLNPKERDACFELVPVRKSCRVHKLPMRKKGKLNVVSAACVKRNYTRGRAACTSRLGARGTEDAEKTAVGGGEVERSAARCWGDYLDILIYAVTEARK